MEDSLKIISSCLITDNQLFISNQPAFSTFGLNFQDFTDAAYKNQQITYPKFYKMDSLSKLGFLTAEYLISNYADDGFSSLNGDEVGIIVANKNSSTDTDLRHHHLIQQGITSPALFVYTLPNILIGEICIRHGIKGENTFFISDDYEVATQVAYVSQLFAEQLVQYCVAGWVDYTSATYKSFLCLIGRSATTTLPNYDVSTVNHLFAR